MSIKAGNYEVVSSGTIIQIVNEPIEIKLTVLEIPLVLIMKFIDDDKLENLTANFNTINKTTMEITFNKFNNSVGAGNSDLIELALIKNRKFCFNYRIQSIKNLGKTLHYSFYLGEEIDNA